MMGWAPDALSAEEQQTLLARAQRLAAESVAEAAPEGQGTPVLLCRLHDEQYALELAQLRAVQPARGLVPIPCTPASIAGMLNVRGTVVTAIDLARILDLAETPPAEEMSVVLVDAGPGGGQGQVGLLVHEVLGVEDVAFDTLDRAFSGNVAVRGIAAGGVIVLDLPALLADGRFATADE